MGPTQVAEQEQMATATETQVLAQAQVLAPAQVAVQVQVQLRSKPSISHLRAERAHQSMSQRAAVPSDENQTVAPERVALAQGLAAMEPAAALLPDVLLGQVERAQSPARVVRVPEQARPMSSR